MATRREFIKLAAGAAGAGYGAKHSPCEPLRSILPATSSPYRMEPFEYSAVTLLDGPLKNQYAYARNFYLSIPDDNLLLGFRQRAGMAAPGSPLIGWYGGAPSGPGSSHSPQLSGADTYNAFGQYISGMARMAKATNDPAMLAKASSLIEEWAKTIDPDGYFYYSRHPWTPHYIYEKTACGLVDMYAYNGSKPAIQYLERITSWAEQNLDRSRVTPLTNGVNFGADGTEWYTLAENLYRAYELTGDFRYRRFAEIWHYDNYWGMFNGKVPLLPYGRHAYSHVNTLSSAAMSYKITGDPQFLTTIVRAYDWLQQTQTYATGGFGPGEKLVAPDGNLGRELEQNGNTFETVCGSWAIFKLCRYLLSFTGDAKYGDWIEKAVYNCIGAALPMRQDGRNFYYSDYRIGGGRKIYNALWKWTCCSGTYPQTIADYHNVIYFHNREGLFVNLFVPSEVNWQGVVLRQETGFPQTDSSTLTIKAAPEKPLSLRIRIPSWCNGASLTLNGEYQAVTCEPGSWATIHRSWKTGDQIVVRLPMDLRFVAVDQEHPKRVAIVYGPVVLVRRQRAHLGGALDSVRRNGGDLSFRGVSAVTEQEFVPFYSVGLDEPYEMYYDLG